MSTDLTTPPQERRDELIRRPRRRGEDREQLHQVLADAYNDGASIRALAAEHDLSYGLARTLLLEAKVELRNRRRRPKAADQ
ncbi:helix-turn-helix domain-containing protein [Streptomyces sp. ISL-86]|uniref:helix-turn-helix domain-containing protein n=1 Tax=Streptomyces sp. ISL-86 TaxID=2819187 RepID=UPI001BE7A7C7|nr:helix-turn-helix domain-containing protein [Streptomyces sp. ISL-86]MBT2453318.1 transcriptional regulator [Streptomyces sp. ISL-86]